MSTRIKLSIGLLTVILSCLGTATSVIWMASAKAADIDACKQDIAVLKVDVRDVREKTVGMAATSKSIENTLEKVESRLHGISTQIGQQRAEQRALGY